MACGDKYRHLIRTRDGRGPDDPCWAFCGVGDYDQWRDVAKKIADEVWRRWDYVLQTEQKIDAMPADKRPVSEPYPERAQLVFLIEDFARKLEDVPHPVIEAMKITEVTWSPAVRRAIDASEAGVCVMEELDKAAAYYDAKPLPGPHAPSVPAGGGMILLAAIGLGVGLYFIFRKPAGEA